MTQKPKKLKTRKQSAPKQQRPVQQAPKVTQQPKVTEAAPGPEDAAAGHAVQRGRRHGRPAARVRAASKGGGRSVDG